MGYCTDDNNKDMKFVLLHEGKNDDGIRAFFTEVWELYTKVSGGSVADRSELKGYAQTMMNPFHTAHSMIVSAVFDARVRVSAKKHL